MPPLRTHLAIMIIGLSAAGILTACGGGEGGSAAPTATLEVPTATAQADEGTPTLPRPSTEAGEEPIFYRTLDGFATLRANEPYKVLFRITNGYAEETLTVRAEREGEAPIEFDSSRAEAQGGDLPGSYYPTNVELPTPGDWVLVVVAGEDRAEIPVEVASTEG